MKKFFEFVKGWYNADILNKAMLFTAVPAFFVLLFSGFDKSGTLMYIGIGGLAFATACSLIQNVKGLKSFKQTIKEVEFKHKVRESEMFGQVTEPCYDAADKKFIKQKKKNFYLVIGLKLIMIVILIAFML
jgi:hypothetical protein